MADKKAFLLLANKVSQINISAGHYLRTKAPELDRFVPTPDLGQCFLWSDTPQGHDYWSNINDILEGDELNESN